MLKRYKEAGLTMPLLWPPFADVPVSKTMDDLKRLKEEIMPKVIRTMVWPRGTAACLRWIASIRLTVAVKNHPERGTDRTKRRAPDGRMAAARLRMGSRTALWVRVGPVSWAGSSPLW
jgi:hypothetical protein